VTRRVEDRDLAHEHDMEVLRKQQLRDDCGDWPVDDCLEDNADDWSDDDGYYIADDGYYTDEVTA